MSQPEAGTSRNGLFSRDDYLAPLRPKALRAKLRRSVILQLVMEGTRPDEGAPVAPPPPAKTTVCSRTRIRPATIRGEHHEQGNGCEEERQEEAAENRAGKTHGQA
ncbi:hypothetical protein [Pseudomonas lopnurensis]|uniref:hypothetical protein n=1 Tax=Pseudomonas lopnurensis TaxID=1477517 RepID=UPI00187AD287|nr:hypothetical protein [Pseudomonas lopnurensis]MBE7373734.1 hypothetical protein [Pseudomonas lopnurensis]